MPQAVPGEVLSIATLAQTDALNDLLVDKALVTRQEILDKIAEERVTYQRLLNPTQQ